MDVQELFHPVDKGSSTDVFKDVLMQVIYNIKQGNLNPGDSLPPERALAETLGISRPVLREVLKSLELIGVVKAVHGSGNHIADNLDTCLIKPMTVMFELMNSNLQEISELRAALEIKLSTLAAEKCSGLNAAELAVIYEKMKTATDIETKIKYDQEFHRKIAEIADNRILNAISLAANGMISDLIVKYHTITMGDESRKAEFIRVHKDIINGIVTHDKQAVNLAMSEHMHLLDLALNRKN